MEYLVITQLAIVRYIVSLLIFLVVKACGEHIVTPHIVAYSRLDIEIGGHIAWTWVHIAIIKTCCVAYRCSYSPFAIIVSPSSHETVTLHVHVATHAVGKQIRLHHLWLAGLVPVNAFYSAIIIVGLAPQGAVAVLHISVGIKDQCVVLVALLHVDSMILAAAVVTNSHLAE